MSLRVLNEGQTFQLPEDIAVRPNHAARRRHGKAFAQHRMNFSPVRATAKLGRHDHIERTRIELIIEMVAGPGFQQKLATL